MYKTVFQNSKVALLFAGMTLFSAVSMVGTQEESGLLGKAVDRFGAERDAMASGAQAFAEGRSKGDAPGEADAVFGEFDVGTERAAIGPAAKPKPGSSQAGGPMDAPLSSTAMVVESGGTTVTGVPFISDREMTIEPE